MVEKILEAVGVRNVDERWTDTHVVMTGEGVVGVDASFELAGMDVFFGQATGDDTTSFRFEYATERGTLLDFLGRHAYDQLDIEDPEPFESGNVSLEIELEPEDADSPVLLVEGPPVRSRVTIRDLGFRIRLPADTFQLGQLIEQGGEVVGIEAAAGDEPVEVTLPQAVLIIDTQAGISLELEADQLVDVPPVLIRDSGFGFEVDRAKIDLSETTGIREVLALGVDESWRGVFIEEARIFGLNRLLPFLPRRVDPERDAALGVIEMSQWLIGSDGLTGSLDVRFADALPESDAVWKLGTMGIEFDRGELVRGSVEVVLRMGGLSNDLASIGPDGDLALGFALRHHRGVAGAAAWGFDISVRTPGTEDRGLASLDKDVLLAIQVGLFPALVALAIVEDDVGIVAMLVGVAALLQSNGSLVLERLTLDALTLRYYTRPVGGHDVRFLDIVVDLQTHVSLDLSALLGAVTSIVGDLKTEEPLRVDTKGLTVTWAVNLDAFANEPLPPDVPAVQVSFDPESGITFDLGESSFLRGGRLLQITQLGVGRWDGGIYLDLGLRVAGSEGDLSYSVVPTAVRLFFNADGSFHDVDFKGLGLSLLVPNVIYCTGRLETGDVTLVEARAFIVGNGNAVDPADHKLRGSYLWDAGVGIRHQELASGDTSLVVTGDLGFPGGIPLGSMMIYGFFGHYATNARPDLGTGGFDDWYRVREPRNQITVSKFTSEPDTDGFGVGIVFGSPGGGKAWNAKAGLLVQRPGPVLVLAGTASFFKARPSVKSQDEGELSAVIVLDLDEDYFLADVHFDYRKPADGKLVAVTAALELFSDFSDSSPEGWHFYVGEHLPVERRVAVRIIDLLEGSAYLMVDSKGIANLAGSGVDIPGTAWALGVGARVEWGRRGGRVRLYLYAVAELHLAFDFVDPFLFFGLLHLEGGLVFKVYGIGFDLGAVLALSVLEAEPSAVWGEFRVKVNLPWPIPDVKFTVDFGDPPTGVMAPPDEPMVSGLAVDVRGTNESRELDPATIAADIPIDPTFTLAFPFPVRNAAHRVGSFNLDSVETTTYHFKSGNSGHRFNLVDLTLWEGDVGTGTRVEGPFPAKWIPAVTEAPGGQVSRQTLELFAYDGVTASRYLGTTAKYYDALFERWDPCPPGRDPTIPCYSFDKTPPGAPATPLRLEAPDAPDAPDLIVAILEPGPAMELLRRVYGLTAAAAEVVPSPMFVPGVEVERALRLPGAAGFMPTEQVSAVLRAGDAIAASVELRFDLASRLEIDVVAHRSANVDAAFFDGSALLSADRVDVVEIPWPPELASFGPWESHRHLRLVAEGPVDRAILSTYYLKHTRTERWEPAYLLRACAIYEAELRAIEDEEASRDAWQHFWSDLLDQDAGASDALLLKPATRYTLEATLEWAVLQAPAPDAAPEERTTGLSTHEFAFRTVGESPKRLRGREDSMDLRVRQWAVESQPFDNTFDDFVDDWSVATVPGDETFGFYPDRALRLVFPDARTDALFAAFDERLVLRLVDHDGLDLFDALQLKIDNATALPEYQRLWQGFVADQECTPADVGGLWKYGWAVFDSVLATNRWYDGSLVAVPEAAIPLPEDGGLAAVDFSVIEPVYRFRFKTSRWRSLAEHIAALQVFDEVCEETPDPDGIAAFAGATADRVVDDGALDRAIVEHLRLPFRGSPTAPELVRVWREEPDGGHTLVALLLDGPEPLPDAGATLALRDDADAPIDHLLLQGSSRARSLVVPRTGGAVGLPATSRLRLAISEPWVDATGSVVVAEAALEVAVTGPAFLGLEVVP